MPSSSLRKLLRSFRYAGRGFDYAWQGQNFRIQILGTIVVLALIIYFKVTALEAAILILVTAIVLVLEVMNTVLEKLSDLLEPRYHHYVAMIKDIAAGAVFITAIGALIIGLLIFTPYFWRH